MKRAQFFACCVASSICVSPIVTAMPDLSKTNISVLYNKSWEPDSSIRSSLMINARTITISGRCPTPYVVLDATRTNNANYIFMIREDKSGVQNAPMMDLPGCFSDGEPFIALQILSPRSLGDGMRMWHCASYGLLSVLVKYLEGDNSKDLQNFLKSTTACRSETWHIASPSKLAK